MTLRFDFELRICLLFISPIDEIVVVDSKCDKSVVVSVNQREPRVAALSDHICVGTFVNKCVLDPTVTVTWHEFGCVYERLCQPEVLGALDVTIDYEGI